ncbi:MAG: type II toxin-antitoxin system VapC family toxin [Beutenbergiaceae bacterium]
MLAYIDTSTLLKLAINEVGSDQADTIWVSADAVASVSLITVEARAALAAARRGNRITSSQHESTRQELDALIEELHIVEPTNELIAQAATLAEVERLRGYDAVHLSSALVVGATILSSADQGLCAAAQRRGFHVANPLDVP